MGNDRISIIHEVTMDTLATIKSNTQSVTPEEVRSQIMENVRGAVRLENIVREKGEKIRLTETLLPQQVAWALSELHPICLVETIDGVSDDTGKILGMYQTEGEDEGIYVTSEDKFEKLARKYNPLISTGELKEMFACLKDCVPQKQKCKEKNLIAVNNGIFDFDTKQLRSFTPDLVFLSKSRVDYKVNVQNPVIHNNDDGTDWDVESWMADLSDDPSVVHLLWQILGAIIRPNVAWDRTAWLYSESGNNGKGTLCELMRELCGKKSYAAIPLADFSKDFYLTQLLNASAVIVDENDVGTYIDRAANFKAVVTGDAVTINRKFKDPITYQFRGFMVQCLNEMPRVKDKSDSFYRRQVFIPFTKCFTGAERKYIKQDYLHRPEVLEYVLHKVLHMDYYELDVPQSCQNALNEYKEFNDPVRQFVSEIFPELQWDLVPFTFLYDLYKAWYVKNVGRSDVVGKQVFIKNLIAVLDENSEFICEDKSKKYRTGTQMDKAEPLIAEYDLKDWMNPMMSGSHDMEKRCHPVLKEVYRGIVRNDN